MHYVSTPDMKVQTTTYIIHPGCTALTITIIYCSNFRQLLKHISQKKISSTERQQIKVNCDEPYRLGGISRCYLDKLEMSVQLFEPTPNPFFWLYDL